MYRLKEPYTIKNVEFKDDGKIVSYINMHGCKVVMSVKDFNEMFEVAESTESSPKIEEDLALLKMVHFGKNDVESGRVMDSEEFKSRLKIRKDSLPK